MSRTPSKRFPGPALVLGALLLPVVGEAQRQPSHDASAASMGAATYETYCASCHGKWGDGDGPLSSQLGTPPTDLTELSRKNGGRFPFDRVRRSIDGRRPVKAHGAMPAWGDAFRESREGDEQARVSERIAQLTQYLASIQKGNGAPHEGPAAASCVFRNPSGAERCTETADIRQGSSPHEVCEEILRCLNNEGCIKTYCQATTIRRGWKLESATAAR